jgi:hypothetical protein
MYRRTVNICLIARSSMNVLSPQVRGAVLLGMLLLAACLPEGSLASTGGSTNGSHGRHLVMQVRGSG